MFNLSEICQPLNAKLYGNDARFKFISFDTRSLQAGELYIALKGENHDGHDFVKQAAEAGAVAVLVEHPVAGLSIPYLQVKDTLKALTELARWRWKQVNVPVLAITGSCGKTTVKEMSRFILSECAPVLASQKTFNNHFGVPYTLLRYEPEQRFAVIEMGANHLHEIKHLTSIVQPQVAIINNVGGAHLEGFGSLEGVARAKAEIYEGLVKGGTAIINRDDNFADFWLKQLNGQNILTFGMQHPADFSAHSLKIDAQGCYQFIMQTPEGEVDIHLPLPGHHQVMNALAATAGCYALAKVNKTHIQAGLSKLKAVPGRLMLKKAANGALILDDTYNANLDSLTAALHVLAKYSGERVLVLGEMRELGAMAKEHHVQAGLRAKALGIERLYAYGEWTAHSVKAFGEGGQNFPTQQALIEVLKQQVKPNMVLLVKGSRSTKMENIVSVLVDG